MDFKMLQMKTCKLRQTQLQNLFKFMQLCENLCKFMKICEEEQIYVREQNKLRGLAPVSKCFGKS